MRFDNLNLPNIPDLEDLPGYNSFMNFKLVRKVRKMAKYSRTKLFNLFLRLTSGMTMLFILALVLTLAYELKIKKIENCSTGIMLNLVDIQKYRFDSYDVMTEDGYTLQIFRLRNKKFMAKGVNKDQENSFLN